MTKIVNREIAGLPIIPWVSGKPTVIVLHETANNSNNGSYEGERTFMSRNYKNAFYHIAAGEKDAAVFHDPAKGGAWGSGPAMHAYAIHIELVRSSTREGFLKAYNNWIGAAVYYAKKYGIPMIFNSGKAKRGFMTHKYVTQTFGGTTHQDPDAYLARWGVTIAQLGKDLAAAYNGNAVTVKPSAKPARPVVVHSGSIVDYLKAQHMDSSLSARKKLASQYGIKGYTGTAAQNIKLLELLQKGKSASKPASKPAAKPKPQAKGTVHLPASAKTWRTYKLGVQPVKKNSDWSLTPSRYGGLTYEILGRPYPNVVTIMTGRGKRNIYVGPETGAVIK